MKVYIASHCRWAALHIAASILSEGHEVVSKWHYKDFKRKHEMTENEKYKAAIEDYNDILKCDAIVLLSGPDKYPGGKFVEAGIAFGLKKPVCVIGKYENVLMWLSDIVVRSPKDAAKWLNKISKK